MARDSREQRRARREARDPSGVLAPAGPSAAEPPGRPPKTPSVAKAGADGPGRESKAPGHVPGSGVIGFIKESVAELKKVEWPTQAQVVTGTTVVLIACIIVGIFLYANDEVWKRVVQHVILR